MGLGRAHLGGFGEHAQERGDLLDEPLFLRLRYRTNEQHMGGEDRAPGR